MPDSYSVDHDRTLTVPAPGVLGNDLNLLGGETAILDSGPAHGDLTLRSHGGFTYTPDAGYVGSDSFRYHPSGLLVVSTTVTITIRNTAPVANADSYAVATGVKLSVAAPGVLANDTDANGDALSADLVDGGGNGSLDLNGDGSFTFTSGGSFAGVRTFTYRAWDGVAWSNTTTVSIQVGPVAPTPTPTPAPTPTPSPTPLPLPLPTLPLPTLPLPTLPLPTIGPTPTPSRDPAVTPRPSAEPSSTGAATPNPSSRPGEPSTAPVTGVTGGSGGGGGDNSGGEPPGPAAGTGSDGFVVGGGSAFDPVDVALGDDLVGATLVDFAVPGLVLTVPGLLLVLAVLSQGLVGAVWLPVVRRWLGGYGLSRSPRRRDAA
jgi:hypothetical protein